MPLRCIVFDKMHTIDISAGFNVDTQMKLQKLRAHYVSGAKVDQPFPPPLCGANAKQTFAVGRNSSPLWGGNTMKWALVTRVGVLSVRTNKQKHTQCVGR